MSLALYCLVASHCVTGPEFGQRSGAIVGGAVESGWPAVVALTRYDAVGAYAGAFCTGALIAPRWVLTAAHCLVPNAVFTPSPSQVRVFFGADATAAGLGREVAVEALIPHPDYQPLGGLNDVALVQLLTAVDDVEPLALSAVYMGPAAQGAPVTHVGFGVSSGLSMEGAGLKRSVLLHVDYIGAHTYVSEVSDAGICFGDSGGPALSTSDEGVRIIGVNASVAGCAAGGSGCDPCLKAAIVTRVDPLLGWLSATMGLAAPSCHITPAWCRCPEACTNEGSCDDTRCDRDGCAALYTCVRACAAQGPCVAACEVYGTSQGQDLLHSLSRCLLDACGSLEPSGVCPATNCGWLLDSCAADAVPERPADGDNAGTTGDGGPSGPEQAVELDEGEVPTPGAAETPAPEALTPDTDGPVPSVAAQEPGGCSAGNGAWSGVAASWLALVAALAALSRQSRRAD